MLDANLNRLREGLRVLEEIARFVLDDAALTAQMKELRHRVTAAAGELPGGAAGLLQARDAGGDVGAGSWTASESTRSGVAALATANFKRGQEAARVLEEFGKLSAPNAAGEFKKIRFAMYGLEQETMQKMR